MKPWVLMTLCLACSAAAACRSNSYRTTLEQESRQWEERFYVAQDRLEECENMLEAALQRNSELENAAGRGGGASGPAVSKSPGSLEPPSIEGFSPDRLQKSPPDKLNRGASGKRDFEEVAPPADGSAGQSEADSVAPPFNPPAPGQKSPQDFNDSKPLPEAPQFEPSAPAAPGEPRRLEEPILPGLEPQTPPADRNTGVDDYPALPDDNREVAQVEIIGMASDGFEADGRAGDDGVQFVLQPRDGQGRPIDAAGPISVVIVDPLPEGKSVRVARWDLTTRQAAGYHDPSLQGFHLQLPWPASQPKHSRLRLFVRYTTADGRNVQAEKEIAVNLLDGRRPAESVARRDPPVQPGVAAPVYQERVLAQPPQSEPRRKRPEWSPERP